MDDHALDLQTAQAPAWASERAGSGGRDEEEGRAAEVEEEAPAEEEAAEAADAAPGCVANLRWFLRMTDEAPWTSACT